MDLKTVLLDPEAGVSVDAAVSSLLMDVSIIRHYPKDKRDDLLAAREAHLVGWSEDDDIDEIARNELRRRWVAEVES